jgi:hypothetical protein
MEADPGDVTPVAALRDSITFSDIGILFILNN